MGINLYNRIILVGRLCADPELRQTPNGNSVTSFTLAVDRAYSRGEKQTDFIDIVAWKQTAEFICQYFQKGGVMLAEGSLQSRRFTDKAGNNRTSWEVVADRVSFVGNKQKQGLDVQAESPTYTTGAPEDFAEIDGDSDLPF